MMNHEVIETLAQMAATVAAAEEEAARHGVRLDTDRIQKAVWSILVRPGEEKFVTLVEETRCLADESSSVPSVSTYASVAIVYAVEVLKAWRRAQAAKGRSIWREGAGITGVEVRMMACAPRQWEVLRQLLEQWFSAWPSLDGLAGPVVEAVTAINGGGDVAEAERSLHAAIERASVDGQCPVVHAGVSWPRIVSVSISPRGTTACRFEVLRYPHAGMVTVRYTGDSALGREKKALLRAVAQLAQEADVVVKAVQVEVGNEALLPLHWPEVPNAVITARASD